jgi:hypothetical protein
VNSHCLAWSAKASASIDKTRQTGSTRSQSVPLSRSTFHLLYSEQPLVQKRFLLCSELKGALRISGFSTGPRLVHVPTCMRILRRMNLQPMKRVQFGSPEFFLKDLRTCRSLAISTFLDTLDFRALVPGRSQTRNFSLSHILEKWAVLRKRRRTEEKKREGKVR